MLLAVGEVTRREWTEWELERWARWGRPVKESWRSLGGRGWGERGGEASVSVCGGEAGGVGFGKLGLVEVWFAKCGLVEGDMGEGEAETDGVPASNVSTMT